jgi:hypothetical protein
MKHVTIRETHKTKHDIITDPTGQNCTVNKIIIVNNIKPISTAMGQITGKRWARNS